MLGRGLRIAVDAVGTRRASGGAVVLLDLLDSLLSHASVALVVVFASSARRRQFAFPEHRRLQVLERPQSDSSRAALLRWVTVGLDQDCAKAGVDGLVSLNALGCSRTPTVVLFQQQLMFAPEAVRLMPLAFQMRLWAMRRVAERVCRRARLVVAQAEHVASSLARHFRVDPQRIRVVMPDVRWPATPAPSAHLDEPTLLYVGSDRPYKAVDTVLQAFQILRAQRPSLQLALTLAKGGSLADVAGRRYLGNLPRQQVKALLGQATLLVMPSLAETLGLPLLEALDVGCPIVAADLPYAREVCGPAALYFKPLDAVSCAACCEDLLSRPALALGLAELGRSRMAGLREREPMNLLAQLICQAITSEA